MKGDHLRRCRSRWRVRAILVEIVKAPAAKRRLLFSDREKGFGITKTALENWRRYPRDFGGGDQGSAISSGKLARSDFPRSS